MTSPKNPRPPRRTLTPAELLSGLKLQQRAGQTPAEAAAEKIRREELRRAALRRR